MSEQTRRANNRDRILAHLQARGSAYNHELVAIGGMRFGARLLELRREGWAIETRHDHEGVWQFVFHGRKQDGQQELFA